MDLELAQQPAGVCVKERSDQAKKCVMVLIMIV